MEFKTIEELITYYKEHYGMPHRIHIKTWHEKSDGYYMEYYWYSVIPIDVLRLSAVNRRWSTNLYADECGITRRELLIN